MWVKSHISIKIAIVEVHVTNRMPIGFKYFTKLCSPNIGKGCNILIKFHKLSIHSKWIYNDLCTCIACKFFGLNNPLAFASNLNVVCGLLLNALCNWVRPYVVHFAFKDANLSHSPNACCVQCTFGMLQPSGIFQFVQAVIIMLLTMML